MAKDNVNCAIMEMRSIKIIANAIMIIISNFIVVPKDNEKALLSIRSHLVEGDNRKAFKVNCRLMR